MQDCVRWGHCNMCVVVSGHCPHAYVVSPSCPLFLTKFLVVLLSAPPIHHFFMRYASPSGPMCLRCLVLNLSGPVELCCGECYVGCLLFECFPIYVSVSFVCFVFDCVGVLLANPCIVFQEYVCCFCDPNVCLGFPPYV